MSRSRIVRVGRALRELRRPADLSSMRAAGTPHELGDLSLIPAGRNLGVAIRMLPLRFHAEATAALLACRVLDAYEDLAERDVAPEAVRAAAAYLAGHSCDPPVRLSARVARDSEAVDLLLADRIGDVRALIVALPGAAGDRVGQMLCDVAQVMSANMIKRVSRIEYSEGVLGRVTLYGSLLVTDDAAVDDTTADLLRDWAGCVGVAAQLANDLRDGELELHGAADRDELTRTIMLQLLAPALGSLALIEHLGRFVSDRGARAGIAYMAITTTSFLCGGVGQPGPYSHRMQLPAAIAATRSEYAWDAMTQRLGAAADGSMHRMLDDASDSGASFEPPPVVQGDTVLRGSGIGPLIIDTTFKVIGELPPDRLTGDMSDANVRRMMIADHLAFGALDRLPLKDADAMGVLARRLMATAVDTTTNTEGVPQ